MSTFMNDQSHGTASRPQPALNTLPSELRRLIVSHLAPSPDRLYPGSKRHLKSANLTHSCLREWVLEYMFRDMALKHVLVGMSSHLECFAASPNNAELLKLVKHIVVQVPPALRWEIGMADAFGHHLEEITSQRLCSTFGISKPVEMTEEQLQYSSDYHRAMVEPFTDNRSWYRLLRAANISWGRIFSRFSNLEEISVGCCHIVDQPSPTCTHTFILQHGKDVVDDPDPPFVADATVNMAWASAMVVRTAPTSVRRLGLSMANMDNYNSFATINRLQSLSYRQPFNAESIGITRLTLTLRGIAGTHGNRDWHGETGSAGSVRHWKSLLNSLPELRHLDFYNDMSTDGSLYFSDEQSSDSKACILDWILPGLILKQLRTLRLRDFLLDTVSIQTTFAGHWPCLEILMLDEISLMLREDEDVNFKEDHTEHLQGKSWLETCHALSEKHPRTRIVLSRPSSNVNDMDSYRLHSKYVKKLSNVPAVDFDTSEPYSVWIKPPKEEIDSAQERPLLSDVSTTAL